MNAEQISSIVASYQANTVRVCYEDMANPLRIGIVVEHKAGEFRVCWDEGGEAWSDLRQAGWTRFYDFKPGQKVNAFHPRMMGVLVQGRIVGIGERQSARVDFGKLRGGVFWVQFDHIYV